MTTTPATSGWIKTATSPSSKKSKLKIVPFLDPYPQQDIIELLTGMLEEAKAGKIANLVIYRELKNGDYFLHTTPSEDTLKTASHLLQLWFVRMGLHQK